MVCHSAVFNKKGVLGSKNFSIAEGDASILVVNLAAERGTWEMKRENQIYEIEEPVKLPKGICRID